VTIDKNTFEKIYDTFRVEKIIYLEITNEPDISDKKNLLLYIKLLGIKGSNLELKLHQNNTCTFVHHINKCLEEFNRPIVCLKAKLFQSFCLKQGCRNLINFKFIFDLNWFVDYNDTSCSFDKTSDVFSTFLRLIKSENIEIYKNVFQKLICHTIPSMENQGVVLDNEAYYVYPHYTSKFQENGRLNSKVISQKTFNPHALTHEIKANFVLPEDDIFASFDFKALELYVLAYLSNDPNLNTMLYNTCHPYEQIAQYVLDLNNFKDSNYKDLGKKLFLPAIYGISSSKLAETLDCSIYEAQSALRKTKKLFEKAFLYVEQQKAQAENYGFCFDYFKRKKSFHPDDSYKAMNFSVHSPAAVFCFMKMNEIQFAEDKNFRLLFSVHDCFVFSVKKSNLNLSVEKIKEILQKEFTDYRPLKLIVDVKVGNNLAFLKNYSEI
jgi:hypothetical protein